MQFTNIGKAVLAQMLGLQRNHKETIEYKESVLDEEASGCRSCKVFKLQTLRTGSCDHNCSECSKCSKRAFKETTRFKPKYVNEYNQFGYKCRLKPLAIKIMLALHFCSPDKDGFCLDVNPAYLAKRIGCSVRSIKNNFDLLNTYGYIEYSRLSAHGYIILLKDYENYYKHASEGGRGYVTIGTDLFNELAGIKGINKLRVVLRELLDFDNLLCKGKYTKNNKTVQQIRDYLPSYCKPWLIEETVMNLDTDIFQTDRTESGYGFTLNQKYNTKTAKGVAVSKSDDEAWELIWSLNREFQEYTTSRQKGEMLLTFFGDMQLDRFSIPVTEWQSDISPGNLGELAVEYSIEEVLDAIIQIYKDYALQNVPIQNPCGLIRSIIKGIA